MKISNNKTNYNSKKVWLIAAVLLLLAVIAGVIYFQSKRSPDPLNMPVDYSSPTKPQSDAGTKAKENAINRSTQNNSAGSNTTGADLLSFESDYRKDAGQIVITTKLNNAVSWDKCYLELSQGSTTKSFEARTVYQSDASFCGGFTVDAQGMAGTWSIALRATDLSGKEYKETGSVTVD